MIPGETQAREEVLPKHEPHPAGDVLTAENYKVGNAPVSFPPVQRRWASDYGRSAAYKSAAFKDLLALQATYIDDTFGKFPGTVPSVWIMNYLQAQHIDLDYYDTVLTSTAYLSTHREHQQLWH